MGQALYRKYRSKSMAEIVGQEHITTTLDHALKAGRISHAYLFTGPRGVGKTSIARILAHAINDLPYDDDSTHMDIIEIDAASNRRIDEIRELRDKVYVAPTSAKYKVYIIDEVHMLTKEAFNALLKTLEEPPAHVVFILATTDAHKLPDTIVSRTQRFTFKPVDREKVIEHLRVIAKTEGIKVSDEALALLAEHGEGSFRDSISLLDQASNQGQKLELSDVQSLLGIPPEDAIKGLLQSLEQGISQTIMKAVSGLYEQGFQAAAIAKQLSGLLRTSIIEGSSALGSENALKLLADLLEVPIAHDAERYLEIVLLQSLPAIASSLVVVQPQPTPAVEPVTTPAPKPKTITVPEANVPKAPKPAMQAVVETPLSGPPESAPAAEQPPQSTATVDDAIWPQVLTALKLKYNTLYGVIRMAHASFSADDTLTLTFNFAFHQKRIMEAKNQQVLADIIKQVTGKTVHIACLLDKTSKTTGNSATEATATKTDSPADLANISNIFGGGELLES